ncbi:lipoate--protein ligase family protein [Metallosphaera tengchongensis]|uniref:Lipoate--protein ligase family protein n=1 Tax=Metallosphaera tengchongensis TaxID=1532350 RepID=A0A6N0NW05_9CREN|nr:biotin/lipoate A/B protein ligase family protein [Metallosphaera tengchongensis]QKR00932.1 lipoate--protein ligase family protein [Metallosphaera tengchongensis]
MPEFRFLVERGPQHRILAGEEALLESVAEGSSPLLRFVIFEPTAVLLGYHQLAEQEINLERVKEKGWDVGRRPTGGGTIIMGPWQLGWEIYAESSLLGGSVESAIRSSAEGVIDALSRLGIKSNFRPKNDVEINGKKISGIGAFSVGKYMSVTGTILVDFNVDDMVETLKLSTEKMKDKVSKDFRERITWLNRELQQPVSMEEVIEVSKKGFQESLKVNLKEGAYSERELNYIKELELKYSSREWIFGLRKPLEGDNVREGEIKLPGGLFRVQVKMAGKGLIESVLITGDFFVEPRRSIYDLEARLKWSRVEDLRREVTDWFNSVKIVGVDKENFIQFMEGLVK